MKATKPAVSVTVVRENLGAVTRLLQYAGVPHDDELQTLLEHVARLVSADREATSVEVVLGGGPDEPQSSRLRDALHRHLAAARLHVEWAIS